MQMNLLYFMYPNTDHKHHNHCSTVQQSALPQDCKLTCFFLSKIYFDATFFLNVEVCILIVFCRMFNNMKMHYLEHVL